MRRGAKHLAGAVVLVASLCFVAGSAQAWEFEMTGSMQWYWMWTGQFGAQGFFGPYNVDNGAGTTTANLNWWWGAPTPRVW